MNVTDEPAELVSFCDRARRDGKRVGFVPTMGALHAGHMALVAEAARRAEVVVVSIFVNPTQFGPGEDLTRYPRTLTEDGDLCRAAGVAQVFAPETATMYPRGEQVRVRPGDSAKWLCGAHRPGHFEGVCTVVAKLFALVGPSIAVFGRKDYQQWRVVSIMARDLFLPIEVVAVSTVREPDGLALSSRNRYLSPADRPRALALARGLSAAVRAFDSGERRAGAIRAIARADLVQQGCAIDYVEVATADDVLPIAGDEQAIGDRALLAIAARIGTTRLIDNVVLGEDPPPIAP